MKPYLSKLLENGIILAFFTGIAYYLTYLYLDGSLIAYALPDELIEIDVPDIIATLIDMIYKFWPVLMIPAFGLLVGRIWKDPETTRLWSFTIVMVTSVVFSVKLVNRFEPKNWILLGIMTFEWAEAGVHMLKNGKGETSLRGKWACYLKKLETSKKLNERMALGIGYLAVTIAIMYVLSGAVMEHSAITQLKREDYFVARNYDNKVVVYENGKCYVLMARDGSDLLPAYEIVRYDHIGKLDYEHTGVLNLPASYPAYD